MTTPLAISSGTVAAIVVIVVIDLFAIFFGLSFARSRRAQRGAGGRDGRDAGRARPAGAQAGQPSRVLRRSLVVSLLVFGAEFGGATLAFLWPSLKGGFGSVINAGKLNEILASINENDLPFYSGTGLLAHRAKYGA